MIRVLIADDHAILRDGIKQLLAETPDITVVDEVADGHALLNVVEAGGVDVVLMDISMPGPPALDTIKRLTDVGSSGSRQIPVLVLSMHPEQSYAARFLRAGAHGFISKERAAEQLVEAIRKVAGGGLYIVEEMRDTIMEELARKPSGASHATLSDREFQVLMRMARGMSVKEIADNLSLSVKTVSTYRTRIFEKLGFHSNADLAHYAMVNKLLDV